MNFGTLRTRFLPGALALTLLAGACVNDDESATPGTDLSSDDIVLTSARLQTADSCDALLDHLIAEGVERVGPYGFDGGGYWGFPEVDIAMADGDDDAMEEESADFAEASAPLTANDAGGDSRFSGTNNQEVDVEEADRVKTDGDRLIILRGNTIEVFDVRSGTPVAERTIQVDGESWGSEMFLVGDSLLLLSHGWSDQAFGIAADSDLRPYGISTSKISEIDLATGDIGASIEIEGDYLSAREVDGSIRIVTTTRLGQFDFLYPSREGAEDAAEEANRRIVEESTLEQWIPTYRVSDDGQTISDGQAFDCTDMYIPSEFSGFGALTVLTVDIDDGLTIQDSLGVLSDGQTVYASTDRLTVASNRVPEWDWDTGEPITDEDDYTTALHTFDITDAGRTEYVASGSVRGSLLSQYSLSEHNGHLRVATTEGSTWGRNDDSQSMVTILEEQGNELVQVGFVDGLGKGERIFSVRFMADIAYVVTFREVDPLYTVDLSDPTNPTVLGELKIPGFSTYLHPVGDGLLLGIGQDATDEGFTTGAQASLFDVSDLTDPQRVDTLGFGENSYSAVDWDPKAFLFWGERQLAIVPVSAWTYDEQTGVERNEAAAVLVEIGEDGTLTELGRVGHPVISECEGEYIIEEPIAEETESTDAEAGFAEEPPAAESAPAEEWCWSYQAEVQRSVVIGDALFTISDAGVQVNDLDDLGSQTFVEYGN